MKLEKIISLANKNSEIRFLAMVRSLRDVGCNLPVWVIPYDNNKFDLPDNCTWWEMDEVILWLEENNAHKMMRKYQCLLTENYQYVDSDIVFLKNPETTLEDRSGFITSDGHWRNPVHTHTESSVKWYKKSSTLWQKNIFNAGQYASDVKVFDFKALKEVAENPLYKEVCLNWKTYDQVALNLLVHLSGVKVENLTLPPYHMESTWAGDYGEDFEQYWTDENKKPYLIHWAGCKMNTNRPIDKLFLNYLSKKERNEWDIQLSKQTKEKSTFYTRWSRNLRRIKQALKSVEFE
jgi:hypothetical protein